MRRFQPTSTRSQLTSHCIGHCAETTRNRKGEVPHTCSDLNILSSFGALRTGCFINTFSRRGIPAYASNDWINNAVIVNVFLPSGYRALCNGNDHKSVPGITSSMPRSVRHCIPSNSTNLSAEQRVMKIFHETGVVLFFFLVCRHMHDNSLP